MVTPGDDSERERLYKFMETAPTRSKPLHNFSMPSLKWGNHKFLRCMKVNSDGEIDSSSPDLKHSSVVVSSQQVQSLITHHHNKKKEDFDYPSEKRRSSPVSKKNNVISRRLPLPPTTNGGGGGGDKSKIQTGGGGGDDGIEEIRAKLMFHLRTAAHKMKFDIPEERKEEDEDEDEDVEEEGEEEEEENEDSSSPLVEAAKPWNLRKRRAACNAPTENGKVVRGGGSRNEEPKQNSLPPLRTENQTMKSLRLRGSVTDQSKEKERRKFSIPLSRKEIEEDFMAMLGSKPSRRPTKRPKIIQKQLDAVFPGLWLSEVTVDAYRVPDFVEPGKR